MKEKIRKCHLIAIAVVLNLSLAGVTFAQDSLLSDPQLPMMSGDTRNVTEGQMLKIKGIVVKRNADSFTLRDLDGKETVVALTDKTNVKTIRKGLFRRDE